RQTCSQKAATLADLQYLQAFQIKDLRHLQASFASAAGVPGAVAASVARVSNLRRCKYRQVCDGGAVRKSVSRKRRSVQYTRPPCPAQARLLRPSRRLFTLIMQLD